MGIIETRQSQNRATAFAAESLMANALTKQGWQVIGRNFQQHGFELDVIAKKGTTLVFLEVKARQYLPRTSRDLETLLPPAKKMALRRGGQHYLGRFASKLGEVRTVRFDLAVVIPASDNQGSPKIQYFVDVLN